eukprot:comp11523_c0_seq1/m.5973 comp11523_c0_seq1/g.5973  ORF comp11523_c0_seq1/g.5973 comp11523_c0_seq1/m.5973 type:complete len:131 (-) comp11523_c0_seq1:191-583(-)
MQDRMDTGTATLSFLNDLPCFDSSNFSGCQGKNMGRRVIMTPKLYTPTNQSADPPPDQVIKTDKQNILLRHVYKQFGMMNIRNMPKEETQVKRTTSEADGGEGGAGANSQEGERKRLRLDDEEQDEPMRN